MTEAGWGAGATWATGCVLALFLVGAPIAVALGASGYILSVATRAAAFAIAAVSLQFVLGFGGMVSFGHAAMIGMGAYTVLAAGGADAAWVLPLSAVMGAGFAALTGVVALRTRGVTFIMITLAFGQMAYFVAQALTVFGGDDGATLDGRSPLFGAPLLDGRFAFHALVVGNLVVLGLLLRGVALSRFGRALRAARQSEVRVTALGYDVFRIRLAAYAIGGAGGGMAGFWLANTSEFVSPAILDWRGSGTLLVMVILGSVGALGRSVDGRLIGAAAGATGLVVMEEALALVTPHGALLLGPAMVLLALAGRRV